MVVVGHLFEPVMANGTIIEALYMLIYSIHMPLFVFVSGYFFKPGSFNIGKTVKKTLVPYFIFQTLYSLYNFYVLHVGSKEINYLLPFHILWYLVSLFFWYVLTPYFIRLRHPVVLSFVIAVLIGYVSNVGHFMSISRTFTYYPFFLIGYFADKACFPRLLAVKRKMAPAAVLVLILLLGLFRYISPDFDHSWFWGVHNYAYYRMETWYAGMYRIFVYMVSLLASASFLVLVPSGRTIFSEMGARTLYPFLLHDFIVKGLIALGMSDIFVTPHSKLGLAFCGVALAAVLSTKLVRGTFRIFIEPLDVWLPGEKTRAV